MKIYFTSQKQGTWGNPDEYTRLVYKQYINDIQVIFNTEVKGVNTLKP